MREAEYRIEYTILRSRDGFETEHEVGFGSSGSWNSIDECLHMVESDIQNGCWETAGPVVVEHPQDGSE